MTLERCELSHCLESFDLSWRPYRRPFRIPLNTHHGSWSMREGILLRLTRSTGAQSYGEIAPIPWFGSESLEQALEYCQSLPQSITSDHILQIPKALPATRFGFESTGLDLITPPSPVQNPYPIPICGLLPAGDLALVSWKTLWDQGYRHFKWKIGVSDIDRELQIFQDLLIDLPPSAQIRLDANGGLTLSEAHRWLEASDPSRVEFIEQPLPPHSWPDLLDLHRCSDTIPIALDESVAVLDQVEACYHRGWRGIVVIKPGMMGSPTRFQTLTQQISLDWVFSSVFETPIGAYHVARLIRSQPLPVRPIGYGVDHYFPQDYAPLNPFRRLISQIPAEFDALWNDWTAEPPIDSPRSRSNLATRDSDHPAASG